VDPQLESFIVEIRPWLYRQAFNICKDRADAEDLVQDASERFLESFASLARVPTDNELERWLITIVTNCFVDLCRKRKSEKHGALDPTLERLTVGQPPEPKRLSDTISDEDFAASMRKLSPALRKTLELRLAGKRYHEIAEAEQIPIGAVGKRLSDARKKLLRMLAPLLGPGDH
jgi:RNA polymerase sigma-70 factor (ECF subfamily)